jgi:hypothetical protein
VRLAAWALVGAAPFLALQAVHSAILFSRESFSLVGSNGYVDFWHSRWADTLWSSWHGFLSWTPIAYIALIGTAFYVTRAWRWALSTLLVVFLMAWINGSTADWNAGWSFGGRRFVSCLVVLAPGLAIVIQQLVRRPAVALAAGAFAVVGWNQLLMAQYTGKMLPANEPPSFGQIVRQQGTIVTRPPFFYPFAFPANVWFAWRTGLPVDRYDLLQPAPLVRSLDLALDANATRYLMDGWGGRAADSWGDLRWIDGSRAELILPLDLSSDAPVTISVQARTRLLNPPVGATVSLSINGSPTGMFTPDAARPSTSTLAIAPATGVWKRGFNRFVFEKSGESGRPAPPVAVYRIAIR